MRPHFKRRRALLAAALVAVTSGLVAHQQMAGATLSGLTFEGHDGNIVANGGTDWTSLTLCTSPGVPAGCNVNLGSDPTGQTDNSFVQGSKEDDTNVVVEFGSIPNSKADIGKFAVGTFVQSSGSRAGNTIMVLGWIRNNDSGTTNFDFEINQRAQPDLSTPGPKTLIRKGDGPGPLVDDVLIGYDLQGGAQNPTLTLRRWISTDNNVDGAPGVWGAPVMINGSNSEGATNCAPPGQKNSCPTGPGAISLANSGLFNQNIAASRFGEAALDLTGLGIIPNQNDPNAACIQFAGAIIKSRASDAFTSQMKDFAGPIPVGIDNCGSIEVRKITVPSPDASNTVFDYTRSGPGTLYDAAFTLQNGGSNKVEGLNPGSYTVTEAAEAGWDFTSLVCNDANGNVVGTTANITLDANEDVICTYTNTQHGRVIIDKVTQPDPDPTNTSFDFTSDIPGGAAFALTNAAAPFDSGSISAGTYSVAETGEAGWTLVSATCDDGSSVNAIDVGPGETVTCTFVNEGFGRIIVTKQTDPDGATQSFDYATTGTGYAGFSLTDGQSDSQQVAPGSYSVTETVPLGWELSDIVCDDDDVTYDKPTGLANLVVDPGETINCLYTNEQDSSITVIKQVVGPDPGQVFTFGSSFSVPALANGGSFTATPLDPGSYGVTEDGVPNWLLVNADPTPGNVGQGGNVICSSSNVGEDENSGSINLAAGEHVICTFVNEWQVGAIAVQKTAKHAGPNGAPTLEGVQFQVIADNGATVINMPLTDATGYTCLGAFAPQDVMIREVPVPGYAGLPDQGPYSIVAVSHCPAVGYGNPPVLAQVENIPLTRVSVSVDSLVDGGTSSIVNCVDQDGNGIGVDGFTDGNGDGTFGPSGDIGLDANGLQVITCTITIDP